jgi:hypothetical protein
MCPISLAWNESPTSKPSAGIDRDPTPDPINVVSVVVFVMAVLLAV